MATNNQIFLPARFGAYLRKLIGENRRTITLYCILAFGFALITAFIAAIAYLEDASYIWDQNQGGHITAIQLLDKHSYEYYGYHRTLANWMVITEWVVTIVAASFMFSRCASKGGRLRDLLCPASQFEKFTASFLLHILGAWILALVSTHAAIWLSQCAMNAFTPYGTFFSTHEMSNALNGMAASAKPWHADASFMLTCYCIFLQSLFTLGSSIWPKSSYVKTFGAGFTLLAFYCFLFIGLMDALEELYQMGAGRSAFWITSPGTYIIIALVMTVVNYAIAYFRYREMDMTNKW